MTTLTQRIGTAMTREARRDRITELRRRRTVLVWWQHGTAQSLAAIEAELCRLRVEDAGDTREGTEDR